MPRKKKISLVPRVAYDQLLEEINLLHKRLDEQSERYNFSTNEQLAVHQYIDTPEPKINLIKFPSDITGFLREFFEKGQAILKNKNHDYGNGDVFGNFREFGTQGFLVRMSDKWARIKTFASKGFLLVRDESVQDTLIDLANYCALLAAWLHNERILAKNNLVQGITPQEIRRTQDNASNSTR